jgi:N-acetyl-1-D-myo-inositol-2-amino-2-deoxy-alpha-D-glucopyranoside deacetylase
VHAHPDDEVIGTGATMAHYAAAGAHVTLVTCTLGEEGEIHLPALAQLEAAQADQLGGYRIVELERSCAALGVTDHRFLGGAGRYRDSGMMGLETNRHPRAFWQADLDEAAGHLVKIMQEVRPQVMITYDDNGFYGHPDHIQAHRVAMRAVELAAPAHEVEKVYWNCVPRSVVEAGFVTLREAGKEFPFEGIASADDVPGVVGDDQVTAVIDGSAYTDRKAAAMRAHFTQIAVDGPFFALSNDLGQPLFATEYYTLVRGTAAPGPDGREHDLFAGVTV